MRQFDSGVRCGGGTLREHRAAGRLGRSHPALERVLALALMLMLGLLIPAHARAQSSGVPPDPDAPSAAGVGLVSTVSCAMILPILLPGFRG